MPPGLQNDGTTPGPAATNGGEALVSVKVGGITRRLCVDDIRLVAACENYTEVTLAENQRLLVRRTMQQWAALLPAPKFARVHRGLFLNLDCVGRVERGHQQATKVHFAGGAPAPIDVKRRHWPALRGKLDAWRAAAPAPAAPGKSIAVLPFLNLSRDPANEIFCDGVSEELLNVLAKIPGLHVAARTSAFYFKHRSVPVAEIARQLGVRFVVEGSVRQLGRRVRITAQLIDASAGFHLWSDNFDRELTDLFAIQDEIARLIATNLQLKLDGAARPAGSAHPEVHRLLLEGRHFWNLRTIDSFTRAEQSFRGALALASDCSVAHAGLADLYVVRGMYRLADGNPGATDLLQARQSAQEALALDPQLAEPHAAIGFARFHEGALDDTEPHFQRALSLNPNYATGYQFYAWSLAGRGLLTRALEVYAKAIALDPLSFINIDRYAAMLALARHHPAALAANERASALRPDLFVGNVSQRAPILLALGQRDEAVAIAREVRRTTRDVPFRRNSDADAISVLHRAGLVAEAAGYAAEILAQLPEDNYLRGFILSAVGRFADALPALRHTPPIMLPQLYWSVLWDDVRRSEPFLALIAQLGRAAEYRRAARSSEIPG